MFKNIFNKVINKIYKYTQKKVNNIDIEEYKNKKQILCNIIIQNTNVLLNNISDPQGKYVVSLHSNLLLKMIIDLKDDEYTVKIFEEITQTIMKEYFKKENIIIH